MVNQVRGEVYKMIRELTCHKGQSVARQEVAEGEGRESLWTWVTRVFLRSYPLQSLLVFRFDAQFDTKRPLHGLRQRIKEHAYSRNKGGDKVN